jgi:hypothetical protein
MYKKLIIIAITIYLGMFSYAQNNINMINILKIEQDIVSLENRITDLIKKNPKIANIQGLRQYHILWLGSTNKKEDFLSYSFLHQLYQGYFHLNSNTLLKKRQKYIKTTTLITDSIGNLVAKGDARLVHVAPVFDENDIELAKMFFDKEIDFAFYLHTMRYMITVKDNNLYALEDTKEDLIIYTWEKFIECCFDEWVSSMRNRH